MSRRREGSVQTRVPRAALWLLGRYFHPRQAREFFVGDLIEEYRLRVRPGRGRWRADLWFWIQAVNGILTGWRSATEPNRGHHFAKVGGEIKMTGWLTELKYALRMVLKNRAVTGLAVVTLAFGIGSVTTVFNVVQTILLDPLPYPEPGQLVRVMERHDRTGQIGEVPFTYGNFRDLGEETSTLEHIAAYRPWLFNFTGEETPERLTGALVTARFFNVLAISPALGRFFAPEEYQLGDSVVIIGHHLWVNRYGADPSIVGKSAIINDAQTQIIGVMPESFEYPRGFDLWAPLSDRSGLWQNRVSHLLSVLARMRPRATFEQVEQELAAIGSRIGEQHPESDPALSLRAGGMLEFQTADVRSQLLVLLGAVLAVLLIGCVNVANLQTALASSRSQHFSIRAALGASRRQLIRQSLWESAWIAVAAGAAGLTLSLGTTSLFRRYAPENIPRLDQLGVNWWLVLVAAGVSSLTVFVFGLLPALRAASPSLTGSLSGGDRTMTGGQGSRTRDLLVVVEVALAVVLLVGAGLLLHSFIRVTQEDLGFEPDHLLSFQLYLSPNRYREGDTGSSQSIMLRQVLDEIEGLPEVVSSGLVNVTPFQGGPASGFHIAGQPHPPGTSPLAEIRIVDPGYFDTMKIPLLEGRVFSAADQADTEPVMMVSSSLAQGHLTSGGSLDRHLTMTGWGDPRTARVVGVVGDIKTRTLEDPYHPTIYWPYTQFPQIFNAIVVRTQGDPMGILPAVRLRVWSVDRDQPLAAIGTMVDRIQNSTAERRFLTSLVAFFSALALLLAMLGLYGVISYNIVQRIPEIGLRMALGASGRHVLLMVFRRGVLLTLTGILCGGLGAQLFSGQLAAQLYGTHLLDPITYLAVIGLMVTVSLISCLVPALRALKVDPLIALRTQTGG